MSVAGSRVGVVGGSIAGCAVAVAARRLGCDVTVFEGSSGALEDRGVGIFTPIAVREQFAGRGYLPPATPYCHPRQRLWVVADPADGAGRVLWRQPFNGVANNWGVLWGTVRRLVPDGAYRRGTTVRACEPRDGHATLVFDDGTSQRFDVVVGADGYCSTVRAAVAPDVHPAYAGYVLWRGSYDERLAAGLAIRSVLDEGFVTIPFAGGHAVIYLIPGQDGATARGRRRVNWAIYGVPPEDSDFTDPTSVPPGGVSGPLAGRLEQILDEHLPRAWAAVVRAGGPDVVFVQPIYDHAVARCVQGRAVLVGDAAALSRPHTGSGATKALQDAMAFEDAGVAHGSWAELLAAYDAERCPAGAALVETGRQLGRGLVEDTPGWASMSAEQVETFVAGLVTGGWAYQHRPEA
jgi:2-polyprenyl-6-methoxyphenol hydroxylase-like FAD-dependent oxidoreductase